MLIGRWLQRKPKVLILDEPTRGVDVGARGEIHRLIRGLAQAGMAVLVISSEPDELPDLCDRVLVMAEGRIVAELSGAAMTRRAIVAASYAAAQSGTVHERNVDSAAPALARREGRPGDLRALRDDHRARADDRDLLRSLAGAFPTLNNFINVLNQASLAMIIAGG